MVNSVVEVEDPTAQITDLNISSLKESPDITAQSYFFYKGQVSLAPPLRFTFLFATYPIKSLETTRNRVQ